ncbi:MAG: deoxyguanosinetriphosphate triphosphohydrolase [Alphaproteobacteria bacterium]|nr:deoxyguanosinetriphosphate triphosphohydrolase [Alphaproteobacteria bacterium]
MTDPYEALLAPYACKPSESLGRIHPEKQSPRRNPYQRDRDRIIHSSAFRRLKYKTQVFVVHEGDHFRTRMTHTLEVAQIARSMARVLRVQEDLTEAVALAHDLGHPPFAHCGEDALQICLKDFGGFNHNDQSLRVVTRLEKRYADFDGLNLSWEVLEGMAKHNGPVLHDPLPPTIAEITGKMDLRLTGWTSLEAQIGNLSDDIAYNNHDLDDGLRAGFFKVQDLFELPMVGTIARSVHKKYPKLDRTRKVNEITRRLMGLMVEDVLRETQRRLALLNPQSCDDIRNAALPMAAFSQEMLPSVTALRKFLMQNLYRSPNVNRIRRKMALVVKDLFEVFSAEPNCLPREWQALIAAEGGGDQVKMRAVLDYVAGMTDRYALQEHRKLFDPYTIQDLPSV